MQKYYNKKRKLNKLKASLLLLMLVCFAGVAQAQVELRMKTGTETISDNETYNFYDTGGPYIMDPEDDPDNNYNWVTWYQHNESYLLHLINPKVSDGRGIRITFNYLLINNDHLRIYEGDLENPANLIADLTCNDYSTNNFQGYTVTSHGNMTIRFESDYHWRDAGWEAEVKLYNYAAMPPVAQMQACASYVELIPGSLASGTNAQTKMYYTTNGNAPDPVDMLNETQEYTGPFELTQTPTTVKTILVEGEGTSAITSSVATYVFNRLITPPAAPSITHVPNTNIVYIIAPPVPSDQNDTYYVTYTTDGTDPRYGTDKVKGDTITLSQPCTVRAVTHGTTCPDIFSTEASETISTIFVPSPEINVTGTYDQNTNPNGYGNGSITCSLTTATIYYTMDGTTPTTSSTHYGTSPITLSDVPAGTTIKAIAHVAGNAYQDSPVVTFVYLPTNSQGQNQNGVFGDVVLLDDREDHNWSYYSKGGTDNPVHSLNPADIKITYYGYGDNTMTTTDTDDVPSTFDGDVDADDVAVGPNDPGNQFIYLKTLENANTEGTGNYPYTMIPNPFSVRPTYEDGGGTTPPEPVIETVQIVTGTGTNQYAPMYTSYADYGFKSEYIIPTSYFTSAGITSGDKIRSITLYQSSTGNWIATNLTIKLLNSTTGSYSGNNFVGDGGTTVYTNTSYSSGSQSTHTFQFTTPFEYTGNNLVVQISSGHNGTYVNTSWYGISSNNGNRQSCYARYDSNSATNYSGTTRQRFLPSTTFEVEKSGASATSDKYRGFYAWRVKRLNGVTIQRADGTTVGVGGTIGADEHIEFVTSNAKGNEVDFEALWAQAYVVESNTATGLHANVSYERNFVVGAGASNINVPVTYSSNYPDGTPSGRTASGNAFTCGADTKFENYTFTGGTLNTGGYILAIGRGVTSSGTISINPLTGDHSSDKNAILRIESGTYGSTSSGWNGPTINLYGTPTVGDNLVHLDLILGNDYDRANGDNSKLSIAQGNTITHGGHTATGSRWYDFQHLDIVVKSGRIQQNYWEQNSANYQYTFYCRSTLEDEGRYPGFTYLTVEGGEFASINGGRGNYQPDLVDPNAVVFSLRMKGGTLHGSIYGAASANPSWGGRRIVITKGMVEGWIAGGCDGTSNGGGPTIGESYIYIGGNAQVGNSENPRTLDGTVGGNIFGAGRGMSNHGTNSNPASMRNSYIVVADNGSVLHNVYGGGEYGYTGCSSSDGGTDSETSANIYVLGGTVQGDVFGGGNRTKGTNTNIYMKGGTVEGSLYGGSNKNGTIENLATINVSGGTVSNVFGGGYGGPFTENNTTYPGTIMSDNTVVNVSGGTINNNVYGGGALGTVTGNTNVTVSGGEMQNVFGAGQGSDTQTANIGGTTTVTVKNNNNVQPVVVPTIAESVYGGGENGNVKQATNPSSKGDPEGPRAIPSVSVVEITGGNISGNVFGGGKMGFTNGGTVVNMSGGTVEGSVFGGAFGTNGKVYVAGQRTVNLRGGTINKHVYGGSRNADDALTFNPGDFDESEAVETASVVNMSGGYVHYQVFASGYFGNVFGSTYAFIGTNAIMNAPYHVAGATGDAVYTETYYNQHQALRIGGSVWAGGDFGNYDGSKFGDPTITGRSHVYIDGLGYDTESNNTTNTNYMFIGGSIYGSGTSCDAGRQGRNIILRNYGKMIAASQPTTAKPYSSATRALYSIQRGTNLTIDNAHVVLLGEGKINSLVTTEKYTIHEFQLVRMANGSSIFLNYPADQIKKFGSYTCEDVYDNEGNATYVKVEYDGLGASGSSTDNKILVNDGAYINIKYTNEDNSEEYGELEGYAHMMSDNANNTCAYARPKQSKDDGNQINATDDNPLDGGFISYDSDNNTYTLGTLSAQNTFNPITNAPGTAEENEEGVQMAYENHTVTNRNGEQYFRIWRAGGQKSYREGVFVAQGDGTDAYNTVDVVISLPAFENCESGTGYYRIKSLDGNTLIDQGTDIMLVNAACYDDVDADDWMYIDGDEATSNFVTGQTQEDLNDLPEELNSLHYIADQPNVNFGLIAIPSGGLAGNENMLICETSDAKIATMQWTNEDNSVMPKVTFRLTYNKNLTNNVVWDPMTITFEQIDCSGKLKATVDVALTVTTLTTIDQAFKTQAYAVVRGTGSATDSYTAKIVLPQYVMHVNTVGEISKWTCTDVQWHPESGYGDSFVGGTNYLNTVITPCNNKFGMTLVAGLNFDNTTGWESWQTVPKDMYNYNDPNYVFGETTARDPIGFDFKLLYDGRQKTEGNYKVGELEFTMHFTNYQGAGAPAYEKDLSIIIEVWFLGQGNNYYIDGVHGNNLYSGKYPNAAKKTLSGIFNRTDYVAGDNIFVVNAVTADGGNKLTWNGKTYDEVTLYRYPGGHQCVDPNAPKPESHWDGYDIEGNASYRGPLVKVEKAMDMTGIVLNGFYEEAKKPVGEAIGDLEGYYHTYNSNPLPNAPLVQILDGGTLSVYGASRMEYNYNSESDGGGIYVADGGVLNLYNGSAVKNNYVSTGKNGGGIYVNENSLVQLSDEVYVMNNHKGVPSAKAGESVDNNIYLSTYNSKVNVGTAETDDPYTKLLPESRVGITKVNDWGTYYYAPVAYSDGGQSYLSNTLTDNAPTTGAIMWDDETKYEILSLNSTHFSPSTNYVYFVGTWVTAVTSEPDGYSASAIDTPEELAWAISVSSGYNGETAAPETVFTLTGDIDMNANIWVPIGSNGHAYEGTFNGNGHVVTGLRSPLNQESMGMFGVTNGATISDLVAQSSFVGGNMMNVGTIIGTMNDGTLSNVEAGGTLTGNNLTENIGGLVGRVNGDATIHSAFAVNTLTGGTNTIMGGLVGTNGGDLYNSYSSVTFAEGSTNTSGLVGVNTGTVENCYNASSATYAFVYKNQVTEDEVTTKGNINYCYAIDGTTSYVGSDAPGNLTGHGTYADVKDRKEIGYMYDDNAVDADNDYVTDEITYDGGKIATWPGLVSSLNQWVKDNPKNLSDVAPWFRPTSGNINGDLPVLGFLSDNSMATEDGKFLYYGSNVDANGLDNLFTVYNGKTANMFLYGNATDVTLGNGNNMLFINEDAVLLQSGSDAINATVGVTFDNSDHGQNAYDYYGNQLLYDWHFMSTPLADAPMGITYDAATGNGGGVNIHAMENNYFPNNLPMTTPSTGVKWDFYTYYEPEYHWINLKRSGDNHWHQDNNDQIHYVSGQMVDGEPMGQDQNETIFVPGKGYMMAISQDSYMSNSGVLNNGDVTITLTNQEPQSLQYNKGWNLVGNPYQAYLNVETLGTIYGYDADMGVYAPYSPSASVNPAIPAQNIHPHQAFFYHAATDGATLTFTPTMATTTADPNSYFRAERVNYPLVNLFAQNAAGNRDLAVVEFNRPELGGATKVGFMTNANFELSAYLDGQDYGLLFTPEGTEKVPVHFTTQEDGTYTLTWDTQNGVFTSLLLVDNMTGTITDMLRSDHYTFDAKTSDYASRFYLTYACTGVEEVNEGDGSFAFFDGSEWVVNGKGQLDIIDVTGRVLFSKRIANEQNRVNLNNVAPGVYMMRVSDGKDTMVQKIVVR